MGPDNLPAPGPREGLSCPGPWVGAWAIMADRVGTEALCRSGPDFVGIDCQHGFFAFEQAATSIQVANLCQVPCFVRVTADQLDWVPRYLDAGADGIVVAMVSSPEEVRRAVRLSRYQPAGRRSYGGGKRNGVGEVPGAGPEAPEVLPMIETAEALASLEEIAEVPGVTGLVVGPVDLGLAMDRPTPLRSDDATWRQALARVVKVCDAHGLRSGMFATDAEDARLWFSLGFCDVIVSSDISFLRRAAIQQVARARETVGPEDPLIAATSADPYAGR